MKNRAAIPALLVAIVVAATRLRSLPRSVWEGEELRFVRSLLTFDPLQQQPEAPGYPLVVGLGKLVNAFVHDPFASLLVLSVLASIAGAVMLTFAFARLLDDAWCGAAGAALLYLSPAMLVFTPLPNAEAVAMALIAATLLTYARGDDLLFGICAGAAVAARPQTIVAMLALVLFARKRRAVAAFVVTLFVTFEPLVEAIGVNRIGHYISANRDVSRMPWRELVTRFIAHPWGPKLLSPPVLLIAIAGVVLMVRRGERRAFGIALFAVAHLAFCLVAADRTDGVQPLLPMLIAPAFFVAAALRPLARFALPLALAYGAAAIVYSEPLIAQRTAGASPAVAATEYAARALPPGGVVVYEPAMEAFARDANFAAAPLSALNTLAMRADVPVLLLADGGSQSPNAKTFAWRDSDIYGKVTTERYRVVSVIPLPPPARYIAGDGVFQLERTADGEEWRWLAQEATITLPPLPGSIARIALSLPETDNTLTINGHTFEVLHGKTTVIDIPITSNAAATLTFHAARRFTPPGETRNLAVQLVAVERR
jgi:hypothetical protein